MKRVREGERKNRYKERRKKNGGKKNREGEEMYYYHRLPIETRRAQ
jgi:hypothetical protein